jgi:Gpi18-like mannosyltransferase
LIFALYLVSKPYRWALVGAVVFCFLATFTHGNGILTFPAVAFYFLCYKNFKKATVVLVSMIVALAIYLYGYEKGQAVAAPM